MPICIVPARQRGTQALTQISGGFKFARAAPLELVLRGHVLKPCIHTQSLVGLPLDSIKICAVSMANSVSSVDQLAPLLKSVVKP